MAECGVDPLRYELQWIDGICYRKHPHVSRVKGWQRRAAADEVEDESHRKNGVYDDEYDDDEPGCLGGKAPESDADQCSAKVHVPDKYLGRVCGSQHARRRELQESTNTEIIIPAKGSNGDIVITGQSEENVQRCYDQIKEIVIGLRSKDEVTHFVSVPLTFDIVKKNLKEFKSLTVEALKTDETLSNVSNLFVNERRLHLTVCCLSLHDKIDEQEAVKVLASCQAIVTKHLADKPITININGLEIMNDDPSSVDVLYANIFEEKRKDAGRLQKICDDVAKHFRESGYMVSTRANNRDQLKLHMTLMNSKFAEDPNYVVVPTANDKFAKLVNDKTFNAVKILKEFGSFDFGIVQPQRLELNVLSQQEPGTGYYRKVSSIKLSP